MCRVMLQAAIFLSGLALSPVHAQDVPKFLFAEDAEIGRSLDDAEDAFRGKSLIAEDPWLNAPLTRLDYILLRIESRLMSLHDEVERLIPEFFETSVMKVPGLAVPETPEINTGVGYSEVNQRIRIWISVGRVGKPKKPMKEFCEFVLDYKLGMTFPVSGTFVDTQWPENALGILRRQPREAYAGVVNALVQSATIFASVSSGYDVGEEMRGYFTVGCGQKSDEPVTFFRRSFAIPTNRPR